MSFYATQTKNNRSDKQTSSMFGRLLLLLLCVHATSAFIAVCVTLDAKTLQTQSRTLYEFVNILLPSFQKTTNDTEARLFVTLGVDDNFWKHHFNYLKYLVGTTPLLVPIPSDPGYTDYYTAESVSDLGAVFIVRVHPTTVFVNPKWVTQALDAFKSKEADYTGVEVGENIVMKRI